MKRESNDASDELIARLLCAAAHREPPDRDLLRRLSEQSADAYGQSFGPGGGPGTRLSGARGRKVARPWVWSGAVAAAALVVVTLLWSQTGGSGAFALSDMAAALQERSRVIVRTEDAVGNTTNETWIDLGKKQCVHKCGDEFVRLYDLASRTLKVYCPSENVARIWALPGESTVTRMLEGKSDVVAVLYEGCLSPLAKLKKEGAQVESQESALNGLPTRRLRAARADERGVEWLAIEIELDARTAEPLVAKVTRKHALSVANQSEYMLRFSYPSAEEVARSMPQIPATAQTEDYRAASGLAKLLDLHARAQAEWPKFRALVYRHAANRHWILWERVVHDGTRWRYDDFRGQTESLNPGFRAADELRTAPFGDLWQQSLGFVLGNVELGDDQTCRRYIRGLQPVTKWQSGEPAPTCAAHTLCPIAGRAWPGEFRIDTYLTRRIRPGPSDPEHPMWASVEFEYDPELQTPRDRRDQHRLMRTWLDPEHDSVCRRMVEYVRVGRTPWRENPNWEPDEPVKRAHPESPAEAVIYEFDRLVEILAVSRTPDGRSYPAHLQRRSDVLYPDGERFLGELEEFIIRVDIPDSVGADAFETPISPPGAADLPEAEDDGAK